MATIHDEIESWLAADLHGQLPEHERDALHHHLVECGVCRQLHQEEKIMHKLLEENLATEKADPTFEQRMLADFRRRVPKNRGSIAKFLMTALRLRATQIAAVAVVLLALVQTGRVLTREKSMLGNEELGVRESQFAASPPSVADKKDIGRARSNEPEARDKIAAGDLAGKVTSADEAKQETESVSPQAGATLEQEPQPPNERIVTTGANIPSAEKTGPNPQATPASTPASNQRKLIRNAQVELEIVSFEQAVQKITAFVVEDRGYLATNSSEKQANGKLRGTVVVKIAPENLDRFLQQVRGLGELKNQTLGTDDVTKAYFDTDARLKNARVMEQRLIDMLKTKTGKVSDLLQVEKELGRVREEIEKMQGELKYWDSQVQFATVTISLAEKDMEEPAAFLLKERAQLALYAPDVEKIYNQIKALASPKTQITNAQLDRDNSGRVWARVSMLIVPEESDGAIGRVKGMGRVENFQVQTERVAQGGRGMSENAKAKRDKVELNVTISRDEQEQAVQQTSLLIRTNAVDQKAKALRALAEKMGGRVRDSSFSRAPNGREAAAVSIRVPMKNYTTLMQALDSLGKVENVSVQRQDRPGELADEANAPADVTIQVYSQGNIVSEETGIMATLRRTVGQGAAALMWSVRMIGVALAFFVPWILALGALIWIGRRIARTRREKSRDEVL